MGGEGWGEDGVPNHGGEEKAAVQMMFILLGVFPDGSLALLRLDF